MKFKLFYFVMFLWAPLLHAEEWDYTAKLSLKTMYLGKLATAVDDNNVLQPYVEINHKNGFYAYLWLNVPLKEGNPRRSLEVEPSVGYRRLLAEWTWETSLTLFDMQNPDVLDFEDDILSPKIKLNNRFFYAEALYYAADGGRDGWLAGVGTTHKLCGTVFLSANINYVDGPLHFEPIWYAKVKALVAFDAIPVEIFVEMQELIDQDSATDPREDQVAFGLSYRF